MSQAEKEKVLGELHEWEFIFDMLCKGGATINIPDTILFNEGHMAVWYYNSPTGAVVKEKGESIKASRVVEVFEATSLSYVNNKDLKVAVVRTPSTDQGKFADAHVLTQEDLNGFFKDESGDNAIRSNCVSIQNYVHSKGGSMMRHEWVYPGAEGVDKPRNCVYKVITRSKSGPGLGGKGTAGSTDVVKSQFTALNKAVEAATESIIRHLEGRFPGNVTKICAEYILDDEDQLWFTHCTELWTRPKNDVHFPKNPDLGTERKERQYMCYGDHCDRPPNNDIEEMMNEEEGHVGKRYDPQEEVEMYYKAKEGRIDVRSRNVYTIPYRSIILDRQETGADPESPLVPGIRNNAAPQDIGPLNPQVYYQQVNVCQNCYEYYIKKDQEREDDGGVNPAFKGQPYKVDRAKKKKTPPPSRVQSFYPEAYVNTFHDRTPSMAPDDPYKDAFSPSSDDAKKPRSFPTRRPKSTPHKRELFVIENPSVQLDETTKLYAVGDNTYLRVNEATTMPYHILSTGDHNPSSLNFVVINDVFDNYESHVTFFRPIADACPGTQILMCNLPGQAYTDFDSGQTLNNEYFASCIVTLMEKISEAKGMAFDTPFCLIGIGNGVSVAQCVANMCPSLPIAVMFSLGGFCFVDPKLELTISNWANACTASKICGSDLHDQLFSSQYFSSQYLAEVGLDKAVGITQAMPNPITLAGRAALCAGMKANSDTRPMLSGIRCPNIIVHGRKDSIVPFEHVHYFVKAFGEEIVTLEQCVRVSRGLHVLELESGHNLFQESKATVQRLILQFAASSVSNTNEEAS